ncbi:MAG: hypothetical protein DI556_10860 [Rhodovulum sulfidophilum]|uniref:Lipoprotein n=1 Tax=Rhodovulum sulfidophilum TaxID=35806 RepID=A0A2W5PWX3_RHOSU|nr:MAG: hypothetical protein DI556_10860 [Rhodovulum sulfidophilum]
MKRFLSLAALPVLAACATEFRWDVEGRIGEDPARGYATARLGGQGKFSVTTDTGLTCSGTYDSATGRRAVIVPAICADGRSGQLFITRAGDLKSGTATGRLNDGTLAEFTFGDTQVYRVEPGSEF